MRFDKFMNDISQKFCFFLRTKIKIHLQNLLLVQFVQFRFDSKLFNFFITLAFRKNVALKYGSILYEKHSWLFKFLLNIISSDHNFLFLLTVCLTVQSLYISVVLYRKCDINVWFVFSSKTKWFKRTPGFLCLILGLFFQS